MKFRPCIDIHNGKVKQIVGSSLKDSGNEANENFISNNNADYFANLYKKYDLRGGHIIILNSKDSEFYEESKKQAVLALTSFENGMQIGGGINDKNALEFLKAGASHVIVTSYVFSNGILNYDNLKLISSITGKNRLVLDVSCRKKDGKYYIVTDRWQKFTDEVVDESLFSKLSIYCDEFLVHAVDVEGKSAGIDKELAELLGKFTDKKITYAGGISSYSDIENLRNYSNGKLDYTVGSALDLFGGTLSFTSLAEA